MQINPSPPPEEDLGGVKGKIKDKKQLIKTKKQCLFRMRYIWVKYLFHH